MKKTPFCKGVASVENRCGGLEASASSTRRVVSWNKEYILQRTKTHNLKDDGKHLPYKENLKETARELRKNQTEAEKKLWYQYLSGLDIRFKRQHPIDNYIVDFYCTKIGLVIEIDGETHNEDKQFEHDNKRTEILENYGLKVIRFSNEDVLKNFEGVCEVIGKTLQSPCPAVQKDPLSRGSDFHSENLGGLESYAKVFHIDLWGLREKKVEGLREPKYHWLETHSMKKKLDWEQLAPAKPFYLFKPHDTELEQEYQNGVKVTDLFPVNSVGIVTARDKLNINWTKEEAFEKISDFASLPIEEARRKYNLGNDARDWKVHLAQHDVNNSNTSQDNIKPVMYRPFDTRYLYYRPKSKGIICMPMNKVMKHMLRGDNIGLITTRQVAESVFNHAVITNNIIDNRFTRSNKGIGYLFPLYLYPDSENPSVRLCPTSPLEKGELKDHLSRGSDSLPENLGGLELARIPNLNKEIINQITAKLSINFIQDGKGNLPTPLSPPFKRGASEESPFKRGAKKTVKNPFLKGVESDEVGFGGLEASASKMRVDETTIGPEDILHYIYAILHSPTYRKRYAGFLKMDFPRIPFTSSLELFSKLIQLGEKLIGLHLLDSDMITDDKTIYFRGKGDSKVEKIKYENDRAYINKTQYFEPVSKEVYEFMVGGYQVANKWLKDRKGRSIDSIKYMHILTALKHTIALMSEVDDVVSEAGGFPIS